MFSAMSLKEKLRRFWAMGPYDYLMFIFPFGVRLILICFIQISLLTTDTFVFFWWAEGGGGGERDEFF